MRPSELLKQTGRAIAYRPKLAKLFGGATAEIFFEQIFYWQDKTESDFGVYKTRAELEEETGLSRKEQETARKKLRELGVLIETHKRLEHRIYFKIDLVKLDELLMTFANETNGHSRMPESDIREAPKGTFVNTLDYNTRLQTNNPLPPNGESANAEVTLAENDSEQEEKSSSAKTKKSKRLQVLNFVLDIYNSVNDDTGSRLPSAVALNEKRKRGIKKFLAELSRPEPDCVRNYFCAFFELLKPFHCGDNKTQWVATLDYAIRPDTVLKVREGAL